MVKTKAPSERDCKVAAGILTEFAFCETMEEFHEAYQRVYELYGLCDDPFTRLPCSPGEYEKNREEYNRQVMDEKYGHHDGL